MTKVCTTPLDWVLGARRIVEVQTASIPGQTWCSPSRFINSTLVYMASHANIPQSSPQHLGIKAKEKRKRIPIGRSRRMLEIRCRRGYFSWKSTLLKLRFAKAIIFVRSPIFLETASSMFLRLAELPFSQSPCLGTASVVYSIDSNHSVCVDALVSSIPNCEEGQNGYQSTLWCSMQYAMKPF